MKQTNFGDYNKISLEQMYNEAYKDERFKKLVDSINLPNEKKMCHTTSFEESVKELKNCSNCKGLAFCKNKIKGFVYYPSVESNLIRFNYVACKREKLVLKEQELSCNYYEMPLALKSASMKNIKVDDGNRVPLIKWLKNFYDSYLDNKHQNGLYLHGSFGSGKTYLVCAMLNELAKKNVDVTIVYYPELLRSLKELFSKNTDFSSRIKKLKNTAILFLDDIGAESVTEWGRDEILGTILQYRMDAKLPTFFTSNLSIVELENHLSSTKSGVEKVKARRIVERIKQLTDDLELVSKNRRN